MNDFIYFEESWNDPNLEKTKPSSDKDLEDSKNK